MTLRDQLLGLDSSVYDQLGKPLMNLSTGGGPVSSFDLFNTPSSTAHDLGGGLPSMLGIPGGTTSTPGTTTSQPGGLMSPTPAAPAAGQLLPELFGGPAGQGMASFAPPSERGLSSIPKDVLAQLTPADIPDLPFNLLTGELSATPQKDMGFVTIHPHEANEWNTPLDFQNPWEPMPGGGESPVMWNPSTGEIGGPLDPGLGSFKSTARRDFAQAGGGPTFDLLQSGRFGNPETAFESLKGFQQDVSSPFEVLGSLLGGISGIAGGFPGFAGLLAKNLSGSSLVGTGTGLGAKLLGGLV